MEAKIQPSRQEQAVELLVFLLLVVPSILISFFTQNLVQVGFVLVSIATISRDLALVALVLFFLWRNGETVETVGWTTRDFVHNLALGVILAPIVIAGVALLGSVLQSLGLSGPSQPLPTFLRPRSPEEIALAVVLVTVVAVSEEMIFRGYLMARFFGVTGSETAAVALSTVIFALGHSYEGVAGMIAVGAMGLIFAMLLVARKSLVAPVVIHFANDFVGIVVVSLIFLR